MYKITKISMAKGEKAYHIHKLTKAGLHIKTVLAWATEEEKDKFFKLRQ